MRQNGAGTSSIVQCSAAPAAGDVRGGNSAGTFDGWFILKLLGPCELGCRSLDQVNVLRRRKGLRRCQGGLQNIGEPNRAGHETHVECSVRRENDLGVLSVNLSLQSSRQQHLLVGQYDWAAIDAPLINQQSVEGAGRVVQTLVTAAQK